MSEEAEMSEDTKKMDKSVGLSRRNLLKGVAVGGAIAATGPLLTNIAKAADKPIIMACRFL